MSDQITPFLLKPTFVVPLNIVWALLGIASLIGIFPPGTARPNISAMLPLLISAATVCSLVLRAPSKLLLTTAIVGNVLTLFVGFLFLLLVTPQASAALMSFVLVGAMLVLLPLINALSLLYRGRANNSFKPKPLRGSA